MYWELESWKTTAQYPSLSFSSAWIGLDGENGEKKMRSRLNLGLLDINCQIGQKCCRNGTSFARKSRSTTFRAGNFYLKR